MTAVYPTALSVGRLHQRLEPEIEQIQTVEAHQDAD